MAKIEIYTTEYCPFCIRAKNFLTQKGIPFTEINLEGKPKELAELKKRTGFRTVPQIFIDGKLIGGCQELLELDAQNKLDKMLQD